MHLIKFRLWAEWLVENWYRKNCTTSHGFWQLREMYLIVCITWKFECVLHEILALNNKLNISLRADSWCNLQTVTYELSLYAAVVRSCSRFREESGWNGSVVGFVFLTDDEEAWFKDVSSFLLAWILLSAVVRKGFVFVTDVENFVWANTSYVNELAWREIMTTIDL
jgi:hypothetical protein